MKQIIVLVATVILGIALASMVFSFRTPAQKITDSATSGIEGSVSQEALDAVGK